MNIKSRILSERKQISLIDYIFELEIQIDRAIQKVQDSKYYIIDDQYRFNKLLEDALTIFKFCEYEGVSRSITNIEKKAHIMYLRVLLTKHETNTLFNKLNQPNLTGEENKLIIKDLRQIYVKISEWEKSTFGKIQTYYEDAYLKIIEARLNRKQNLFKGLRSISEAIKIYEQNPNDFRAARNILIREFWIKEMVEKVLNSSSVFPIERRILLNTRLGGVHVLPNIGIIILSLLYGAQDKQDPFGKSICVAAMMGYDTDCNCGNIGAIMGVQLGADNIPAKWKDPLQDTFSTYVKGYEKWKISQLAQKIVNLGEKIAKKKEKNQIKIIK